MKMNESATLLQSLASFEHIFHLQRLDDWLH